MATVRSTRRALLAVLACFSIAAAHADVIYVRASASGANNGTSWADAYTSLQTALAGAASGDEIWVAAGVYKPVAPGGLRTVSFELRSGVAIYGGFAGTETQLEQRDFVANATELSGDFNGNDPATPGDNSYHVIRANDVNPPAILDGLTVRNGNSFGSSTPTSDLHGGGFLIIVSEVTVRNCIIRDNRAWSGEFGLPAHNGGNGGGAEIRNDSNVSFENCALINNLAGHGGNNGTFQPPGNGGGGGAIHATDSVVTLTNCTFTANLGGAGGFASEHAGGLGGSGGAVWQTGGRLTVSACFFYQNRAGPGQFSGFDSGPYARGGFGGAICVNAANAIQIVGGSCTSNESGGGSGGDGGALSLDATSLITVERMTFSSNAGAASDRFGGSGGAIHCTSPLDIVDCDFVSNRAGSASNYPGFTTGGAGGAVISTAALHALRCNFIDNRAGTAGGFGSGGSGGALHIVSGDVESCSFIGNMTGRGQSSDGQGGAVFAASSLDLTNCVLARNSTQGTSGAASGGAIQVSSSLTMVNCTLCGNTATANGGGVALMTSVLDAANCIFWNNSDAGGSDETAQIDGFNAGDSVNYSIVQGYSGAFGGTGNLALDPLFVSAATDDYRLSAGSPAIDAASNAAVPPGIVSDVFGNPRFADDPATADTGVGAPPIVDMGAAEFGLCLGDIDSDRDVDLADLSTLLSQFGASGSDIAGDLDENEVVDIGDLALLLGHFGALCP